MAAIGHSFSGKNNDSSSTVKAFVSSFIRDEFFSDIIRLALYPSSLNSLGISGNTSGLDFITSFLRDLDRTCKNLKIQNQQQVSKSINLVQTILTIRESGSSIINYDNVFHHLPNLNVALQKLMQLSIQNKIMDDSAFRKLADKVLTSITTYHEVVSISSGLMSFDTFVQYASGPDVSVLEATKQYKDSVLQLYNDLSKLQSVNKLETEKDYFIISDDKSIDELSDTLIKHISSNYSFFKTGFDLFDRYVEGFESSSVHLITAPSNHGKSLFMVNLCLTMIQQNINDFQENDLVMFVTLEDDKFKLLRRFCSIFGNYPPDLIKLLYRRFYEADKAASIYATDNSLKSKQKKMVNNLLKTSILETTQGKVSLSVHHSSENTFSPGDLSKMMDKLKVDGYNVKMVFVDYVDVMVPTVNRYTAAKDYDMQGQIVQELRNISRQHKVPVITATQNNKSSENLTVPLDNTLIGDSYKKVRYSDFIYMCRQDSFKDIFDPHVAQHVMDKSHYIGTDQFDPKLLAMKDQICEDLIPFEVKITKSKDDGRDKSKFALLCKKNLRIYNSLQEYLDDLKRVQQQTVLLKKDIDILTNLAISSVSEDFSLSDTTLNTMQTEPQAAPPAASTGPVVADIDVDNLVANVDKSGIPSFIS